jgi:hypothetical protein
MLNGCAHGKNDYSRMLRRLGHVWESQSQGLYQEMATVTSKKLWMMTLVSAEQQFHVAGSADLDSTHRLTRRLTATLVDRKLVVSLRIRDLLQ